ncbi:hypothetical protein AAAC51_06330 [Priestia megaterium]
MDILQDSFSKSLALAETIMVSFTAVSDFNQSLSAKNLLEDVLYSQITLSHIEETASGEYLIYSAYLKSLSEPLNNALAFTEACLENMEALLDSSINKDGEESMVEGYMRAIIKDKISELILVKESIGKAIALIEINEEDD